MKITETIEQDIAILSISGNIMGGPENITLHDQVKVLIAQGLKKIIIDLKNVKWMNSSGLGVLMACWGSLSREGGNLKLAHVADKVQSLLVVTQLLQFFETYDSVESAKASFAVEKK